MKTMILICYQQSFLHYSMLRNNRRNWFTSKNMWLLMKAVYLTFPLAKIENIWSKFQKSMGTRYHTRLIKSFSHKQEKIALWDTRIGTSTFSEYGGYFWKWWPKLIKHSSWVAPYLQLLWMLMCTKFCSFIENLNNYLELRYYASGVW